MLLVDSSVMIAAVRKSELHYETAQSMLTSCEGIILLDFVVSEIITVLKMRESIIVAQDYLKFILNNSDIQIKRFSDAELEIVYEYFYTKKNKLSFVDCSLVIAKRIRDLQVATFDQELAKSLT